ncbi:MAG TPA: hopanoid-associated sugar epimerase [Thermodesulfovibrionales bacterium]|nr:hopanoid-associated sugar epimerase [Thermodesulfovibrionales bacterium]
MRALVTGATGFVGFHVAKVLRERGIHVVALVREGSDSSVLTSLDAELIRGDVRDFDSICRSLKGCSQLYHVAADYRLWVPDPKTMYAINLGGTRNVMEAALRMGVERVVYTSTVGTLSASSKGKPSHEETSAGLREMVGHYKRSKFLAEREVCAFIERGLPAVIVNPSTPIGPMDRKPTPTGRIIVDFLNGKIPAYVDTGLNFVDVEDVAIGHWLASLKGKTGERYILGNANLTLREFFGTLARMTGRKPPKVRLPYLPVLMAAYADEAISRLTLRHPRVPLTGVKMARKYMFFDCSKAVGELNMPQNSVEGAMARAIDWFETNDYIKR